jgi:hypothetical protein
MPPFLPVRAFNRSQRLRIGNQQVTNNATTYVDLGQLPVVLGPHVTTATSGGTGLAESTQYFYAVTACDAYGGETPISAVVNVTTGADLTSANSLNWIPVTEASGNFTAVATTYNVYRGTVEGTLVRIASGVTNHFYTDTGVNSIKNVTFLGGGSPPTTNNTYYAAETNQSARKDLSAHSAIGSYYTVGGLSNSNSDTVVNSGATTAPTNLVIAVAAGELKVRSTGVFVPIAGGNTTLSAASSTEDRTDLVWVNAATGAQGHTSGTPAAIGQSVPPAVPAGDIPVAAYLVAKSATAAVLVADLRPRP